MKLFRICLIITTITNLILCLYVWYERHKVEEGLVIVTVCLTLTFNFIMLLLVFLTEWIENLFKSE